MDEITRQLIDMTGGVVPPDDMITLRKHSKLVEVDGRLEVVVNPHGCLILAKHAPDPVTRALMTTHFESIIKEMS